MPIYGGFAPTHGQTLGSITISGFTMQILKLDWPEVKREAIEVTNMNVLPTATTGAFGNKMFIPSAYVDPGELKVQVNHDPTQYVPIANLNGPVSIDVKLGPATIDQETFDCQGFLVSYEIDGPLDGKALTATATFKLTDAVGGGSMYDNTGAVGVTLAS